MLKINGLLKINEFAKIKVSLIKSAKTLDIPKHYNIVQIIDYDPVPFLSIEELMDFINKNLIIIRRLLYLRKSNYRYTRTINTEDESSILSWANWCRQATDIIWLICSYRKNAILEASTNWSSAMSNDHVFPVIIIWEDKEIIVDCAWKQFLFSLGIEKQDWNLFQDAMIFDVNDINQIIDEIVRQITELTSQERYHHTNDIYIRGEEELISFFNDIWNYKKYNEGESQFEIKPFNYNPSLSFWRIKKLDNGKLVIYV